MNIACPRYTLSRALKMLCESLGGTSEDLYRPTPKTKAITAVGKLKVGDTLPNFKVNSLNGGDEGLVSSADGKKTAYLFLRYYGCTVCRLDIHNIKKIYPAIQKAGCEVKVILQSDRNLLLSETAASPLPFDIVCDPDARLYEAFDVAPARSKLGMLGGATIKKVLAGSEMGYKHGKYEGEELQLPLTVIADEKGQITYVRYGKNIADTPSGHEILALLTK